MKTQQTLTHNYQSSNITLYQPPFELRLSSTGNVSIINLTYSRPSTVLYILPGQSYAFNIHNQTNDVLSFVSENGTSYPITKHIWLINGFLPIMGTHVGMNFSLVSAIHPNQRYNLRVVVSNTSAPDETYGIQDMKKYD